DYYCLIWHNNAAFF
nr:immunoglobulin light chain junction region [Macaca mulatta]